MAGIGSTPPVIYVNRTNPWSDAAYGISDAITKVADAWNRKDAMQQAEQIQDPTQRMMYLQKRLGEEGGKLAAQQMGMLQSQAQIAASQASVRRSDAEVAHTNLASKLTEMQLQYGPQNEADKHAEAMASVRAANASAAGAGARAALEMTEVQQLRQKMSQDQKNQQLGNALTGAILGGLTQNQVDKNAQQQQSPPVQRQDYQVPDSSMGEGPQARPISDTTMGPAGGQPTPAQDGVGASGPTAQIQLIQAVQSGQDPVATTQAPLTLPGMMARLTPAQKMEAAAEAQKGNVAGAMKVVQEANQPTQVFQKVPTGVPGITVNMGLYSDGTTKAIPGTIEDNRKPIPPQLNTVSNGALQWYNTSQILRTLGNANPEDDVMGTAAIRRLNSFLQSHGLQPTGDSGTRSVREAYQTVFEHNRIGLTQLLTGTRQTQALRDQMQATLASPTDTMEIRNQKLAATDLTAKVLIKNEVDNARASGTQIPPNLLQLYTSMGLDKVNVSDLRDQYLTTFSQLGVVPDSLDALNEGGGQTQGPTETRGVNSARDTMTPEPAGAGGGWKIERQ